MGTAALIFILRSLIQKLQAIACRLSGEKKAQGLSQGTMSCCPIQLKQFTILVLYILCLNPNSERQKEVAFLQQMSATSFQALPLPNHIYFFYNSPGNKFLTSDQYNCTGDSQLFSANSTEHIAYGFAT